MNKRFIILFAFFGCISGAYPQISDSGFAKYLHDNRNFDDLIQLDKLNQNHLSLQAVDSIKYYTGIAFYNLQELDKGIEKFSSISDQSTFYNASRFFAAWSELYLGILSMAGEFQDQVKPSTNAENELLHMFKTGHAMMDRNHLYADSLLIMAKNLNTIYEPQWERMQLHNNRLKEFNPKSYGLAGILSGILPGAGKLYTGQKGAAVSSLLSIGAMAAITVENGMKSGWNKWNTIAAASIFSVFYIGNIYGSIVSVRVYRERFYNEVDRAILLDINIPLRDIYR